MCAVLVVGLPRQVGLHGCRRVLLANSDDTVAPSELEALLLQHPDVADAAVVGVYDKEEATELPRYVKYCVCTSLPF